MSIGKLFLQNYHSPVKHTLAFPKRKKRILFLKRIETSFSISCPQWSQFLISPLWCRFLYLPVSLGRTARYTLHAKFGRRMRPWWDEFCFSSSYDITRTFLFVLRVGKGKKDLN